uniref:Uncharacterized protein n=1 Tax=Cyprinus carpio carpio TaxID=630221 RepID=A0A8C1DZU5_CYPCA
MDKLTTTKIVKAEGGSGGSGKETQKHTETVTTTRLTSLPPKGNSSSVSSQQVLTSTVNSSGSGGASGRAVLVEKKIITQSSAEGGTSRSYVISSSSSGSSGSSSSGAGSVISGFDEISREISVTGPISSSTVKSSSSAVKSSSSVSTSITTVGGSSARGGDLSSGYGSISSSELVSGSSGGSVSVSGGSMNMSRGGGGGAGSSAGMSAKGTSSSMTVSKFSSTSPSGTRKALSYSTVPTERKTSLNLHTGGYEGSSSGNSSPEYVKKEYVSTSVASRGRTHTRESEIRARLQSASPSSRWTELDDVKRLLKGSRSGSISPPRSPTNTLPIPKKASVDTRHESQSGYDGTVLDAGFSGYYTNPNNLSYTTLQQPSSPTGGMQNNLTLSSSALGSAAYGMHNNLSTSGGALMVNGISTGQVYGAQKNVGSAGFATTVTSVPSSPITADDVFVKDGKFIAIGKDNVAAKKETERLIMSKNTGKQFITSTTSAGEDSEDSLKREKKMISSITESTMTASRASTKDKATYAGKCLIEMQNTTKKKP